MEQVGGFYYVLYIIVILVVAVLIANTLLMSVFERTREVGILASLGMKGRQIMLMVLFEAVILAPAWRSCRSGARSWCPWPIWPK